MATHMKNAFKRYGRSALFFHSTVFASTLAGSYAAIDRGFDLEAVAKRIPFIDLSNFDSDASTLALAYLSTVATGPIRGALTIAASPILARLLTRSRLPTKF